MIAYILAELSIPGSDIINNTVGKGETDLGRAFLFGIAAVFILSVVYLLGVKIPDNKAKRRNDEILSKAFDKLSDVSIDTHKATVHITDKVSDLKTKVSTLLSIKQQEIDAISAVAEKTGVDVTSQIDRAQGALNMLHDFEK